MTDYNKDLFDENGRPIIAVAGTDTGLFDAYGRPYKALATPLAAPTGRSNDYTIAAYNAPDHVKAQADYVCTSITGGDTTALQAAVTAYKDIYLSEGDFYFTELTGVDNLRLHGAGKGTIIHKVITPSSLLVSNANSGQADVVVDDATGFTTGMLVELRDTAYFEQHTVSNIVGTTITLNANLNFSYTTARTARLHKEYNWFTSTGKTGIEVSDMTIKSDLPFVLASADHTPVSSGFTLVFTNCTKSLVKNVQFSNLSSLAVYFSSCTDSKVRDCFLDSIGDGGLDLLNCNNCSVESNTIRSWGCAGILDISGHDTTIIKNNIVGGAYSRIHAIVLDGSQDCTISLNAIKTIPIVGISDSGYGIRVQKANSTENPTGNSITGNTLSSIGKYAILVGANGGAGNIVSANTMTDVGYYGVWITEGGANINSVSGNTFTNCGTIDQTSLSYGGVYISGATTLENLVNGNIFNLCTNGIVYQ